MNQRVHITVNGMSHENEVEPRLLLVHYVRDVLGLTGTHIGCETSICGACTVLKNGELDPIQEKFWECHGLQCGFCTPGMLMAAKQLLSRNSDPTDEEIRWGIEGNLCRCTGYQQIVEAIRSTAKANS